MTDAFFDALDQGRLPSTDATGIIRDAGTTVSGMRVIDLAPEGGVALRVLPDRGLDIGQAWFGGTRLAWISAVGETAPLDDLEGMRWSEGFGGGLMVTCGLRNVGMPSEGHGLHGTYSHLSATGVEVGVDEALDAAVVEGVIVDEDEPVLIHRRRITVHSGVGRVVVEDETENQGKVPAVAPILYHYNFGEPLWADRARLELSPVMTYARDVESRDVLHRWQGPMAPETGPERVLEHRVESTDAWARITNPEVGISLTLRWDGEALPWLNQWIDPNPGMRVLGLEPANVRTRGRAYERAQGSLPVLEPGAVRRTAVTFEVESTDQ